MTHSILNTTAIARLRPTAFVASVIAAVQPLVGVNGWELKRGRTTADVWRALVPICGHFTVSDAVLAALMLRMGEPIAENGTSVGDSRAYALFEARCALLRFASTACASDAACVAMRKVLVERSFSDDACLADCDAACRMMELDAAAYSSGRYRGSRLGEAD